MTQITNINSGNGNHHHHHNHSHNNNNNNNNKNKTKNNININPIHITNKHQRKTLTSMATTATATAATTTTASKFGAKINNREFPPKQFFQWMLPFAALLVIITIINGTSWALFVQEDMERIHHKYENMSKNKKEQTIMLPPPQIAQQQQQLLQRRQQETTVQYHDQDSQDQDDPQEQQQQQQQQQKQQADDDDDVNAVEFAFAASLQEKQQQQQAAADNLRNNNNNKNKNHNNAVVHKKHSKIHVVFSTSCGVKQDWQSYLFFYQAMVHQQQGTVTRIVSGCSDDEKEELSKEFQEKISIMSNKFHLHFTPQYGKIHGKKYADTKYWNKPFGLKHWLENTFGYSIEQGRLSTYGDDDIVVLADPDMLIQRPFVNHFPEYIYDLWIEPIRNNNNNNNNNNRKYPPIYESVSHGKPMAQDYIFGDTWLTTSKNVNLTYVVGPDSPVHRVTSEEARIFYAGGPPYIATTRDMYQISYYWAKFLPRIFDLYPNFMAEMYAYCMAAAHLELKHQLAQGFMVSNAGALKSEGWGFLNNVTADAVCNVDNNHNGNDNDNNNTRFQDKAPHVIHYCQRYSIGDYFFFKYNFPKEFWSCDFPLMKLPPKDIATYTNHSHYVDGTIVVWDGVREKIRYQNAYIVCNILSTLNGAGTFYKNHHCPNGANYEQTWNAFTTTTTTTKR